MLALKCAAASSNSELRKLCERARIYALRHAGARCGCDMPEQRAALQRAYVTGAQSAVPGELPGRMVLEKIAQDEQSLTVKIWL